MLKLKVSQYLTHYDEEAKNMCSIKDRTNDEEKEYKEKIITFRFLEALNVLNATVESRKPKYRDINVRLDDGSVYEIELTQCDEESYIIMNNTLSSYLSKAENNNKVKPGSYRISLDSYNIKLPKEKIFLEYLDKSSQEEGESNFDLKNGTMSITYQSKINGLAIDIPFFLFGCHASFGEYLTTDLGLLVKSLKNKIDNKTYVSEEDSKKVLLLWLSNVKKDIRDIDSKDVISDIPKMKNFDEVWLLHEAHGDLVKIYG